MTILGIESSCDDTSVALLEATPSRSPLAGGEFAVLSEKTADQIDVHKKYGGVVPEIAGRMHAEKILPLIEEVMKDGGGKITKSQGRKDTNNIQYSIFNISKPDVIAVTAGPGLMTGLMVGVEAAKALAYLWDVPVVRVNHIEGHIYSVLLKNSKIQGYKDTNKFQISNFKFQNKDRITKLPNYLIAFPALCLVVSGGHTELILMKKHGKYELIGKTRDDAAGEAFDKAAKLLGLEYPGGPKISQLAEDGDPTAIDFPRPMLESNDFDFSFAGLKTAALYWLRDNAKKQVTGYGLRVTGQNDFCASFEQAIIDVLVTKTIRAAKQFKPKTLILAGGVSANKKLRETLADSAKTIGYELLAPNVKYAMDNAAMIAAAGYFHAIKKDFTPWQKLEANANWKIYNVRNTK